MGAVNQEKIRSDLSLDGCVSFTDALSVLQAVLMSSNETVFDINQDGKVDFGDVLAATKNIDTQCSISNLGR
jgi:predicted amino acid racemase